MRQVPSRRRGSPAVTEVAVAVASASRWASAKRTTGTRRWAAVVSSRCSAAQSPRAKAVA